MVTGGAGFIGSNLAERLLTLDQEVLVIDDFSTGRWENLEGVRTAVVRSARPGSRSRRATSQRCPTSGLLEGADVILHQAALGSVPRSIARPADTHRANVDGTFRLLKAAVDAGVPRLVFASSSSVYGDDPADPDGGPTRATPLAVRRLQALRRALHPRPSPPAST